MSQLVRCSPAVEHDTVSTRAAESDPCFVCVIYERYIHRYLRKIVRLGLYWHESFLFVHSI